MVAALGVFIGGFAAPVPVLLLILAAAAMVFAVAAAGGRFDVGMEKALAQRDWERARRRRAELATARETPDAAFDLP